MFVGRELELERLKEFAKRRISGLIVCCGRRRIGKSTLIEEFGKAFRFIELYGLSPTPGISKQDQLDHFGELLGRAFNITPMTFTNWNSALETLAALTTQGRVVILLDEISWMASKDKNFPGKLKGVWDTKFKKNPELVMVLCGSVSSWIQKNILNDKGFVGRVSLTLTLKELPLPDVNKFWATAPGVSAFEKAKLLCVTGGIPRYLEEIRPNQTVEQNLKRLAFTAGGLFVDEFDKIFRDLFGSEAKKYRQIVEILVDGKKEASEICKVLNIKQTGGFSTKLNILKESGFIQRDYSYKGDQRSPKLSKYRLSDNYLRFYLKYILPKKKLIDQDMYADLHLENLPGWDTVLGLQFENLILNNLSLIVKRLGIAPSSILSAAPYFQYTTQRQKGCQIDLLIQTIHTIYVCEIKLRKIISASVIGEVKEKIARLKVNSRQSIRPILIFEGDLAPSILEGHFFSELISFSSLLV